MNAFSPQIANVTHSSNHTPSALAEYEDFRHLVLLDTTRLAGSPGNITTRKTSSGTFYYRQYYADDGRKKDEYVGPANSDEGNAARLAMQKRIDRARTANTIATRLRHHGFAHASDETCSVIEAHYAQGRFDAGMLTIGRHAVRTWLNEMGVYPGAGRPELFKSPLADIPSLVSNKISHAFLGGVETIDIRWLRFLSFDTRVAPFFSRRGVTLLRVPSPTRLCIYELARQSRTGDPAIRPVAGLEELMCLAQVVQRAHGDLLRADLETAAADIGREHILSVRQFFGMPTSGA